MMSTWCWQRFSVSSTGCNISTSITTYIIFIKFVMLIWCLLEQSNSVSCLVEQFEFEAIVIVSGVKTCGLWEGFRMHSYS